MLDQNGKIYSATLGLVDIVRGTNSYYKLQLLEDDVHKRSVRVTAERDGLHTFTPVDSHLLNTEYKLRYRFGASRWLSILDTFEYSIMFFSFSRPFYNSLVWL